MADPFKLQQRLKRQLLKERPSIREGMGIVQRALENDDAAWKACRGIDWERGLERWVGWMDVLVKKVSPPPLGLVWFETPSELNPAMTSVSGWTKAGPALEGHGANERRVWPLKEERYTHDAGLHMQPELEEAWERAGWRADDDDEEAADRRGPGVFAIASSYTILLALNGLARTVFAQRWLKENEGALGVLWGWAAGDIDAVGGLSREGWGAFPKVKIAKSSGPPGKLEIISSPKKYLARGGDPRWRDKRTGKTILLKMVEYHPDLPEIKMAVEAGSDAAVADKKGRTALHELGACGAATLKYLISKGADARAVDAAGFSVMDEVLFDGRCTNDQVEIVYAAGGRPRKRNPLANYAHGVGPEGERAERAALQFWLRRGRNINARVEGDLTPLWVAMEEAAAKIGWAKKGLYELAADGGGVVRTVRILLESGADPNARHNAGKSKLIPAGATPLMVGSYYTDGYVRELLKHGAKPALKCAKGRTALEYARRAAERPDVLGNSAAVKIVRLLERAK